MNRLRVLTYHRIAERDSVGLYDPKLVSASPDDFERQMAWLSTRYAAVGPDEVLDAVVHGTRLPRNSVLVTFDDAYPDFKETAWPILKTHGVPATLFVPTGFPARPEQSFWWDELNSAISSAVNHDLTIEPFGKVSLATKEDRLAALADFRGHVKTLTHGAAMEWLAQIYARLDTPDQEITSTLTWDELRSLASDGVSIAAHSRSHPLLTRIPAADLEEEIAGSQADIEREIGHALPVFCYPSGAYDRTVEDAAGKAGMQVAFTTETGHNDLDRCRPLALKRQNITPRTTIAIFRFRLSLPGGLIDRLRKRLKN